MTKFTLLALATCALASCYKQADYEPLKVKPNDVLDSLYASKAAILANGADTVTITAVLPGQAETGLVVTFNTTDGTFLQGGGTTATARTQPGRVNGNDRIIAQTYLRATLHQGTIRIRATVAGIDRTMDLAAVRCAPDHLTLTALGLTLVGNDSTAEAHMVAKLTTSAGTVSFGQLVNASAWNDDMSMPIGTFRSNGPSDANGECALVFSLLPNVPYYGPLHIIATADGPNAPVGDTLTLYTTH